MFLIIFICHFYIQTKYLISFFICLEKVTLLYDLHDLCNFLLFELYELHKLYELCTLHGLCKLQELCSLYAYLMNCLKSLETIFVDLSIIFFNFFCWYIRRENWNYENKIIGPKYLNTCKKKNILYQQEQVLCGIIIILNVKLMVIEIKIYH